MLRTTGLADLEKELMQHVTDVVLTTGSQLQRWAVEPSESKILVEDDLCSAFTEELLKCSQHLPLAPQVKCNLVCVKVVT